MSPEPSPTGPADAPSRFDRDACIVVGSGPTAVACAQALLDRGASVRMLDAGITLESERAALVRRLASTLPEAWSADDLADYRTGMAVNLGGVPLKLVHGSDFPYRETDEHLHTHYSGVGIRPSLAMGGLSNVWGAAMMPYLDRDLEAWPIKTAALARHYSAILELTGLSAAHDALEPHFPLYTNRWTALRPSQQGRRLLDRMEQNREALSQAGIHFGQSRLAVRGSQPGHGDGCVYCRLCMYGCPYGYIYSSAATVKQLQAHVRFNYEPGVIVVSARETLAGVELSGYDRNTRRPLTWAGARAFLAAGAIPSTQILLRSLAAYDQTVWLKDSQYFLLPLALTRRAEGVSNEPLHALSQVFIEMFDAGGADPSAHLQVYSHNDLIGQAVANAFGPLRKPFDFVARSLAERLLVVQGFLHSQHSGRIAVRLVRDATTGDRLELCGEPNPESRKVVCAIISKLWKNARRLRAIPLPLLLKLAKPGRSFHCGGSFPMRAAPRGFETDLLGRPPGWRRIHAVDATVFPSIPATTITMSAMANAHRIGWESASLRPDA